MITAAEGQSQLRKLLNLKKPGKNDDCGFNRIWFGYS
jgi:hypothetical protein